MTTPRIELILVACVVLLLALMFGASAFFSWAWAVEVNKATGKLCLVHPYAAGVALLVLMLGIAVVFGTLLSIPLEGLGVLK